MPFNPIDELDALLEQLQESGRKTVRIEKVRLAIDDLNIAKDQSAPETSLAHWRAKWDAKLAEYNTNVQFTIESFRASWAAGNAAMKSAMIVNGAAAIALLAFLGNIAARGGSFEGVASMSSAMLWFGVGVSVTAFATGMAYLAAMANSHHSRVWFWIWNSVAILLTLGGHACFLYGLVRSYLAFNSSIPS